MKVSILTPTYNHAAFIESTIRSVLDQSYADWEMIIVDDGSTDTTASLAEAFEDPRIRVIRQDNKGISRLGETYNTALTAATGELIAILEGDDLWFPDKLAHQVEDFRDANVVLSAGKFEVRSGEESLGIFPGTEPPAAAKSNTPIGSATKWMLHPMGMTFTFPVTVVMRRSAFIGFIQPEGLPLVDYPTFLEMSLRGEWRFQEEPLGIWRRHESSTTLSRAGEIFEKCYAHAARFVREHREELRFDLKQLDTAWQFAQVNRLVTLGVMLFAGGNKIGASTCFARARTFEHGKKDRLALPIAERLAKMGINPGFIFRMLGRPTEQEAKAGDRLVTPETDPQSIQKHSLIG